MHKHLVCWLQLHPWEEPQRAVSKGKGIILLGRPWWSSSAIKMMVGVSCPEHLSSVKWSLMGLMVHAPIRAPPAVPLIWDKHVVGFLSRAFQAKQEMLILTERHIIYICKLLALLSPSVFFFFFPRFSLRYALLEINLQYIALNRHCVGNICCKLRAKLDYWAAQEQEYSQPWKGLANPQGQEIWRLKFKERLKQFLLRQQVGRQDFKTALISETSEHDRMNPLALCFYHVIPWLV